MCYQLNVFVLLLWQAADDKVKMIKTYRIQVETELKDICNDILQVLDKHLIPCSDTGESKVRTWSYLETHITVPGPNFEMSDPKRQNRLVPCKKRHSLTFLHKKLQRTAPIFQANTHQNMGQFFFAIFWVNRFFKYFLIKNGL